jgi:hypothetical protein
MVGSYGDAGDLVLLRRAAANPELARLAIIEIQLLELRFLAPTTNPPTAQ